MTIIVARIQNRHSDIDPSPAVFALPY